MDDIKVRKRAIADAEWVVQVRLEVRGEPIGDAYEMRYGDSYLAAHPKDVGWLVASRMASEAARRVPKRRAR